MDEGLTRQIKVHCPQHHSTFEIVQSPKIVCEIREHALSNDFPNGEFWEYCCDCQTFSPSDLEVGGKAKDDCSQCGRAMIRRFVCGECKIIFGDSGEDTKGKMFHVAEENRVEPSCPGCLKVFSNDKSHLHQCAEIETVISTTRETCPFCKKPVVKPKKAQAVPKTPQTKCAKCGTLNAPDFYFCRECGGELRPNQNIANRGSSTAKSKLLGSLCPTCGTGNPPDSVFCANCGQKLKAEPKKNAPAPQSSVPTQVLKTKAVGGVQPLNVVKSKGSSAGGLTAGGVILILVAACCVCFNSKSKNDSSSNSDSTTKNNNSSNTNYSNKFVNTNYGINSSNLNYANKSSSNRAKKSIKSLSNSSSNNLNNTSLVIDSNTNNQTNDRQNNEMNVVVDELDSPQPKKVDTPKSTPSKTNSMPGGNTTPVPPTNTRGRKVIILQ